MSHCDSFHSQSAIPPLVLWCAGSTETGDNNRTAIIADVCAAPGSKSLQLLDFLHSAPHDGNNLVPPGLLVVNDSNRHRIVTVCQRTRRVPRAPMLAINMDARYFPGMRRRCRWSGSGKASLGEDGATARGAHAISNAAVAREKAGYKQKYDRVLADVPCSGDGTVRKNKQVWNAWSVAPSMPLHRLQRKILHRAMELLKPGGVVVYSTCSLNPIENEAVVSSVIADVGGAAAMEIVPLPEWLVQKCSVTKGLSEWQVPNPKFGKKDNREMYLDFDDVPTEHRGGETSGDKKKKNGGGQIHRSMFPPEQGSELSGQLGRCGRLLPNAYLDSGGFFVACIRRLRVGELRTKARQALSQNVTNTSTERVSEEEKETVLTTSIEKNTPDEFKISTTNISTNDQDLREGDWICASCEKVNFGRRGGSRCFQCKAKKPYSAQKQGGKEGSRIQQHLLMQPNASVLESFFELFGISTGPESSFPILNTRVMHRANAKKSTIVVVSEALSKLAVSESWSPM